GVGMAWRLGESPILGLACGSVAMTGGHGTSLGFADEFAKYGLEGASTILVASATFGLVSGGLIGGPIRGAGIKRRPLRSPAPRKIHLEGSEFTEGTGILCDLRAFWAARKQSFLHLLVVLACIKGGAWLGYFIETQTGLTFPAYIGAMLLGLAVRNTLDVAGFRWFDTEIIENLSSIFLGLFLAMMLMSLNLIE